MGYNKITLHGEQICDYLYIQSSEVDFADFKYVNSEPQGWKEDTLLFSKFDENLIAGNSTLVGSLNGYELRRKKDVDSHTEYVATLTSVFESKHIIDYMVAGNSSYTYYLYPFDATSESGVTLSPFVSKQVTPKWNYWSLMVVDETEEENVFYLNKLFKFELNLETDDMNNNAIVSITPNFTKYPTVQYAPANYWSGGLTSLCGFISCNDVDYIQTPDMINELKALTTDTRRKFLKDTEGNIWEIKITSPIVISTNDETIEKIKTVKISWTEVGDVSGISIINNPTLSTTSWILTRTGEVTPYIDYVWDNNSVWDNSKLWTAKDSILDVDLTNIGRDLYSKEDDTWA